MYSAVQVQHLHFSNENFRLKSRRSPQTVCGVVGQATSVINGLGVVGLKPQDYNRFVLVGYSFSGSLKPGFWCAKTCLLSSSASARTCRQQRSRFPLHLVASDAPTNSLPTAPCRISQSNKLLLSGITVMNINVFLFPRCTFQMLVCSIWYRYPLLEAHYFKCGLRLVGTTIYWYPLHAARAPGMKFTRQNRDEVQRAPGQDNFAATNRDILLE